MRCFTDEDLERGIAAVLADRDRFQAEARTLATFLAAAQPTPARHPMPCATCGRDLTTATGVARVQILITEGAWRCGTCGSP